MIFPMRNSGLIGYALWAGDRDEGRLQSVTNMDQNCLARSLLFMI